MNSILYASGAAAAVLLIGTVIFILRSRYEGDGLMCLKETWMTAVMGAMLIAMGCWVLYMKWTDAAVAGTDRTSYWFVAGFGLLCQLMGDFALLLTFVKRIVLFDDRVEAVSAFGRRQILYWEEIVRVEKPLTRRAFKLTDKNGGCITVSGDNKACSDFAAFAQAKVRAAQGSDLLRQVEARLHGNHL